MLETALHILYGLMASAVFLSFVLLVRTLTAWRTMVPEVVWFFPDKNSYSRTTWALMSLGFMMFGAVWLFHHVTHGHPEYDVVDVTHMSFAVLFINTALCMANFGFMAALKCPKWTYFGFLSIPLLFLGVSLGLAG